MEQVAIARAIAVMAHRGQKYGTRDYFLAHSWPVAVEVTRLTQGDEYSIAAAYLHDVLEDTGITEPQLRKAGVDLPVIRLVHTLTRSKAAERYDEYIERLINSERAVRQIKLADLTVNLRNGPKESLVRRYSKARTLIQESLTS